jgi:hypothetical protein
MSILTATEVTIYSNISASVVTILAKNLIPVVQARLTMMLNNYFLTDLDLTDTMTFNPSALTIVAGGNSFADVNFAANDDIYIFNSYRNDGYQTIASVSTSTMTLVSGSTIYDELSSRSIIISVVRWPLDVKVAAANMCAYDYDTRNSESPNIKKRSLGPLSEEFTDDSKDDYGYPKKLTNMLVDNYYIGRVY